MEQTPAHDCFNPDLLALMPACQRIIEVGCSTGALAKAYKQRIPGTSYIGIEIDPDYASLAKRYCDEVIIGDIENKLIDQHHSLLEGAGCWVFGDCLEHLKDPWEILREIKPMISPDGCVCACIPNMQHWSIQLDLNAGNIRYQDSGLLDRTHLRWFTKITIEELFASTGYRIEHMQPRIFDHPKTDQACWIIGLIADQLGNDPDAAIQQALPLQYVVRAIKA